MNRITKLTVVFSAAVLGCVSSPLSHVAALASSATGAGAGDGFFAVVPFPTPAAASLPPVPACAQPYFTYLPVGVIRTGNAQYAGEFFMAGTATVTSCSLTTESGTISFSMTGGTSLTCSDFSGTYARKAAVVQVVASSSGCTVNGALTGPVPTGPLSMQIDGVVEYQATNGGCCPVVTDFQGGFLLF